ncbi:hypothetical protein ACV3YD_14825 [Clostridium perfringens]|nr:hypothetical protein [Clostridium perfringens]
MKALSFREVIASIKEGEVWWDERCRLEVALNNGDIAIKIAEDFNPISVSKLIFLKDLKLTLKESKMSFREL